MYDRIRRCSVSVVQDGTGKWGDGEETAPSGICIQANIPSRGTVQTFLLEFVGLKFSLDKFSDMIYGSPVELEMDCQAL